MIKKLFASALVLVLLGLTLTACAPVRNDDGGEATLNTVTEAVSEPAPDTSSFKLSYSKSDSLNPFETTTLNNQVVENLVFESLFIMDENWEILPQLATGYQYKNAKTLVVKLRDGVKFSNGSAMTAENVVYSFEEAKKSPRWETALSVFKSAKANSSGEVIFTLKEPNPSAHKLLTFAISKKGKTKKGFAIGCGRYKYTEGDGTVYLKLNENYYDEFKPHFTVIQLVNITSEESIENAVNIGNISYTFRDMSSGSKNKIQCSKKPVLLNNLVYIGINSNSGITSNEFIRRAISLAIDRDTLVKSAYRGYAKPALSVFNPSCSLGKQTEIFSSTADTDAARQAIEKSGLSKEELKIDILTSSTEGKNAAANILKRQLEAVGFKVTINKENPSTYINRINSGSFTVYVGETKLTNDMSLNSFFDKKGTTSAGIDFEKNSTASSYKGYVKGDNELGKFILDFSQELPFIPLLYRQGMICYSHSLHGDMQGYTDNYFLNIEDWYYS